MGFGKKLFQCFFTWRVKPSPWEDLSRAQVILGQSFGLPADGTSNKALAQIARWLAARYELPLILQWEIRSNLPEFAPDLTIAYVIREHRTPGQYLDTHEVLEQGAETCKERGWSKAVILAHPDHIWRCAGVAEKLGLKAVIVNTSSVPYDRASEQKWTRSRLRFIPREIIARLMFLAKGWI